MILHGDPGQIQEYPVFCMTYANIKNLPKDLIAQPKSVRSTSGHRVQMFMIGGMIYMFYVNSSGHILPESVIENTINPNDEIRYLHIPKDMGWDVIIGYFGIKN
ncbi:MAG: hypothetical protein IH948_09200 [Bacteroidetes bacterium]|nr:hypothetical protein [Bacteroidota bacterium]